MLRKLPAKPRVAFITTPISTLKDDEGFVATSRPRFPPMPEMMLSSALRQKFPDIDVCIENLRIREADRETAHKDVDYFGRKMKDVWIGSPFESSREAVEQADVVCVSNNFTQNAGVTKEFLKWAREVNPDAVVMAGGSDVAARYPYYLELGVDIVVLAEGESRLPAVLERLSEGNDIMDVPGIAVLQDGKVATSRPMAPGRYLRLGSYPKNKDPWATDMNSAPLPALDLVDVNDFSESGEGLLIPGVSPPIMHFESSRGCHECCTFCGTPNLVGTHFRHARTARVRQILEFYASFGIRSIALNEDNLLSRVALDPEDGTQEIIEIFQIMRELRMAWEFDGGIQIGMLWDQANARVHRELFNAMFYNNGGEGGEWVGCFRIYVPLEKLDDKDMKKLHKLQPFHIELELIREIVQAGVPAVYFGIIVGVPSDTDETFRITRERCLEIKHEINSLNVQKNGTPHSYTWYSFFNEILIPGSVDWVRFQKHLAFPVTQNPELWNFHTSVISREDGRSPLYFHDKRMELSVEFNGEDAIERFKELGRYQPNDGHLLLRPEGVESGRSAAGG